MTPIGVEPVELRILEAVGPELFVDEADMARSWCAPPHRVEPLDGERARVTHRMGITGSAVDTLGPHSVVRADESLDVAGLRPGQPLVDVRSRLLDERCLRFLRPDRHPAPFAVRLREV
jgi:hypothetical protein